MTKIYSSETMQFCRAELENIFMPDEELMTLCRKKTGLFLPDGPAAAPIICDKIESALRQKAALSLLRVGNGEGNAISMTKESVTPPQEETFYHQFVSQNGIKIPVEDVVPFCHEVRAALVSADIIGFRLFRFDERKMIDDVIERGDAYAALGVLYAREFLQDGFSKNSWPDKIITSMWIHLDLLPWLDKMPAASSSVIVITGRSELEKEFSRRLGSRLKAFIAVPVQGFIPSSPESSHFYQAFPKVREFLQQDLRGTLVLIGAGLFGKIYCNETKNNGGVAVDLGSAFDVLAGLETRPVHKRYDLSAVRWI